MSYMCLLSSPSFISSGVHVIHFVLLSVFTFWVQCCDVRYYFCIKTFRSYLPPNICRRAYVFLGCLCLLAFSRDLHFVLSYVFTFLVLCCDVRYDIRIETMISSFLTRVVYWSVTTYLCVCVCFLTFCDHLGSLQVLLCCAVLFCLSSTCVLCA